CSLSRPNISYLYAHAFYSGLIKNQGSEAHKNCLRSFHLSVCRLKMQITAFVFALLSLPALVAAQAASAGIQYIIVIDAGSTGTRLNAYKFQLDDSHSTGLRILELRDKKISPGMSAYKNFPGRLRQALSPLMKFAEAYVPASFHGNTTAIVRATAGLRLLASRDRAAVSRVVVEVLRKSPFLVPAADDRAVRVISGREEAEYGWVSVNFLMDTFDQPGGETYGMLDMGGGSTQITFVPKEDDLQDSYRVVFETVRGRNYALHQHSYLGLGMSQAILTMLGHVDATAEPTANLSRYVSPCLHPDFSSTFSFGSVTVDVAGDPDVAPADRLSVCLRAARRALAGGNVHQPPGVKHAKFVAVSSFFYVARQLVDSDPQWRAAVPGNVTLMQLAQAAGRMCANPPTSGRYAPYLCFNLAHIITLLREGYRFQEEQALYVTDAIDGYSAGWSLGLAIHYLTCHDPVIVRCLVPNSSRGSAAASPELWSFFMTAAELLLPAVINAAGA
ncbi:hypothetical protein BOX15_Mlig032902g1, partial [Macrostomum lignano]